MNHNLRSDTVGC